MRDECLEINDFGSLLEARVIIGDWRHACTHQPQLSKQLDRSTAAGHDERATGARHGRENGNGAARHRRRTVRDRRAGIAGGDVVGPPRLNAEDGTPRVIPVGFFWTGTEFVISTATTSP